MFHVEHLRQFSDLLISYKIINPAQVTAGTGVALERRGELTFVLSQAFALGLEIVVGRSTPSLRSAGTLRLRSEQAPGGAVRWLLGRVAELFQLLLGALPDGVPTLLGIHPIGSKKVQRSRGILLCEILLAVGQEGVRKTVVGVR
jgi:hypothetical protein